jgi:[ribosomal protein S18]-alanine N-acetyltransferase
MIVRAARAASAAALARAHAAGFDAPWDEATIAALLATPNVLAFAAGPASAPAGFILLRLAADEAEILTLATIPPHRRRGVALALLGAATEAAGARGARSLFLEVAADNIAARALYTKAQFTPVGARRGYYARAAGAVDALILRRDLNR